LRWANWAERERSAKLTIALLTVAVIACSTSVVASRLYGSYSRRSAESVFDSAIRGERETRELNKSASQRNPQAKLAESLLLTITPSGFDLKEITVPAVPFFLLVENRSGLGEMSVTLQRETGNIVKAARVQREELDWSELLDLTPGRYVISEASHPDQVCRLTVTPK